MPSKPNACIRKTPSGKWRGYIGDVCVAEFKDSATESAEAAAKRWNAAPSKPQKAEPQPVVAPTALSVSSQVTINVDGISDEQKKTEKFKSAYREMLNQLTAPGFIPVLCAHEAAHAVYFGVAGVKEFKPVPPTLIYDPAIEDYKGHLAAYQPMDLPTWVAGEFAIWLTKIAKAHAAGGVVARKLMPSSDGGDGDDRERFQKLCEKFNEDPKVSLDWTNLWKQAQDLVASEIANPEFMAMIVKVASEIRPELGL
jgi:hypothetical protein